MTNQERIIAEQRKEALYREINSHPVIIDRSVFKKTSEEKKELDIRKRAFKNKRK